MSTGQRRGPKTASFRTRLINATNLVVTLVKNGAEYPDASARACLKYDVPSDKLSEAYDALCMCETERVAAPEVMPATIAHWADHLGDEVRP